MAKRSSTQQMTRTQHSRNIVVLGMLKTRTCDTAYSWRQLLESRRGVLSRKPIEEDPEDGGAVGLGNVIACMLGGRA